MINRRIFLRNSTLTLVGTAAVPAFLRRAAFGAEQPGGRTKRLVVIFQRGAADGMNIVVPHAEPAYYAMRPSISIPQSAVLDLDGFFGLHPAMASLRPIWDQKHLAIVHAAGSPDPTRSHFDAQDFMESGTPGVKATEDGWLNRTLHSLPASDAAFRAVAMGPALPRILSGSEHAVAVNNINQFGIAGGNPKQSPIQNSFEAMYAGSVDAVLHGSAQETFDAVKMLKSANPAQYTPSAGSELSARPFWRQPEATRPADQSQSRRAGGICRHRRMGPPRERRQHRWADRKRAQRFFRVTGGVLDRPRRSGRRYHRCDHV